MHRNRKSLHAFIAEHRAELDTAINSVVGRVPRTATCYCTKSGTDHQHEQPALTDSDRRQWVLNDETLYRWAQSEGVPI